MGGPILRHRNVLVFAIVTSFAALPSLAQIDNTGPLRIPGKPRPQPRVGELLEWLHREQQLDGGWWYRGQLPLVAHIHARQDPKEPVKESTAIDTAMAGLAMARAGNTVSRGDYQADVRQAADFLYRRVIASGTSPAVDAQPTPFTVRIGPHVDTFFALLFFLEVAGPGRPGANRYGGAIDVLVRKMEQRQKPDGSWGHVWDAALAHEGAGHAPMLGHAVGVWALEQAVRRGVKVDPDVVALAGKYAMGEAAEQHEWRTNDQWKKFRRQLAEAGRGEPSWCVPLWLEREGVEDDQSVNHELYLMAGRLSVLFHADATNQLLVSAELRNLGARSATADMTRLRDMRAAGERGRAVLEQGRQTMREGWVKIHKRDADPSPSPLFVTGEDFLASLLTVDAMAAGGDVEQWFLPTARRLMYLQDYDGGIRTDLHIRCYHPPRHDLHDDPHLCDMQRSWCSRDRVFLTAAALYMLAADTPYRDTILGTGAGKPIEFLTERPAGQARDGDSGRQEPLAPR